MMEKTLEFEIENYRLQLEVRIERKEPSEGQLGTDLRPITNTYGALSIVMQDWEQSRKGGKWFEVSAGQNIEGTKKFAHKFNEPKRAALLRLCEIWRDWHLNDLTAGTDVQTEITSKIPYTLDWYGDACKALDAADLLVDRGYRFGHAWLVKRIPDSVINETIQLCEELSAT